MDAARIVMIVWEGIEIEVTYKPKDILAMSHLELRIPSRARIPVTETGYRSEYLHPGTIEDAGGPQAYVIAWLDHMAQSREWQDHVVTSRQLSLF